MSLTSVEIARAAYLWRLHLERPSMTDRVAELRAAQRLLVSLHAGEVTAQLATARAVYVAAVHADVRNLDREIADLARLQVQLAVAEQDQPVVLVTSSLP